MKKLKNSTIYFNKKTCSEVDINKHWYYWCPHTDSNREPTDYKSVALPY